MSDKAVEKIHNKHEVENKIQCTENKQRAPSL